MSEEAKPTSPAPAAGEAAKPRNIGLELDRKRWALVNAQVALTNAGQVKATAEAKRRTLRRTKDEITGKRQSCEDIRAEIILARNDPEDEIGKAWIAWSAARALKLKLEADVEAWGRAHWVEINKGRYGI